MTKYIHYVGAPGDPPLNLESELQAIEAGLEKHAQDLLKLGRSTYEVTRETLKQYFEGAFVFHVSCHSHSEQPPQQHHTAQQSSQQPQPLLMLPQHLQGYRGPIVTGLYLCSSSNIPEVIKVDELCEVLKTRRIGILFLNSCFSATLLSKLGNCADFTISSWNRVQENVLEEFCEYFYHELVNTNISIPTITARFRVHGDKHPYYMCTVNDHSNNHASFRNLLGQPPSGQSPVPVGNPSRLQSPARQGFVTKGHSSGLNAEDIIASISPVIEWTRCSVLLVVERAVEYIIGDLYGALMPTSTNSNGGVYCFTLGESNVEIVVGIWHGNSQVDITNIFDSSHPNFLIYEHSVCPNEMLFVSQIITDAGKITSDLNPDKLLELSNKIQPECASVDTKKEYNMATNNNNSSSNSNSNSNTHPFVRDIFNPTVIVAQSTGIKKALQLVKQVVLETNDTPKLTTVKGCPIGDGKILVELNCNFVGYSNYTLGYIENLVKSKVKSEAIPDPHIKYLVVFSGSLNIVIQTTQNVLERMVELYNKKGKNWAQNDIEIEISGFGTIAELQEDLTKRIENGCEIYFFTNKKLPLRPSVSCQFICERLPPDGKLDCGGRDFQLLSLFVLLGGNIDDENKKIKQKYEMCRHSTRADGLKLISEISVATNRISLTSWFDFLLCDICFFLTCEECAIMKTMCKKFYSLLPIFIFIKLPASHIEGHYTDKISKYFQFEPLPSHVTRIETSITWADQGWGNRKGCFVLSLRRTVGIDGEKRVATVAEANLFGASEHFVVDSKRVIVPEGGFQKNVVHPPPTSGDNCNCFGRQYVHPPADNVGLDVPVVEPTDGEIVTKSQPGDWYELWVGVGSGGKHELFFRDFKFLFELDLKKVVPAGLGK